jgi:hypothetical protein
MGKGKRPTRYPKKKAETSPVAVVEVAVAPARPLADRFARTTWLLFSAPVFVYYRKK